MISRKRKIPSVELSCSSDPIRVFVHHLTNYSKKIKTAYIDRADIVGAIPMCAQLGIYAYHTGDHPSQQLIDLCHENDIKVNAFTYDGREVWERLFKMGVDSVTTDFYYALD